MEGHTAEELERLMAGGTVVAVEPLRKSEGHITIVVKKEGRKLRFDIYATDMGWWFEHKPPKRKK